MNIGSIFNQVNNAINSLNQNSGEQVQNTTELVTSLQRGMDILSSLPVGSSLSGTVTGFNEGNLLLQLSEGNMIQARLEGMSQPLIGQNLSFMIKGNSEGNITLSPLYANLNPSSTISNALNAAGLPDDPQTQYIVRSMMEEGLPIDRDSLLDMVRTVNEFPTFDPKDAAILQRLNIPVNEEMLTQFENYKNYEHTIGNSLTDIADSFTESSLMLLEGSDPVIALDFIKETLDILLPENEILNEESVKGSDLPADDPSKAAEGLSEENMKEVDQNASDRSQVLKEAFIPEDKNDTTKISDQNNPKDPVTDQGNNINTGSN